MFFFTVQSMIHHLLDNTCWKIDKVHNSQQILQATSLHTQKFDLMSLNLNSRTKTLNPIDKAIQKAKINLIRHVFIYFFSLNLHSFQQYWPRKLVYKSQVYLCQFMKIPDKIWILTWFYLNVMTLTELKVCKSVG